MYLLFLIIKFFPFFIYIIRVIGRKLKRFNQKSNGEYNLKNLKAIKFMHNYTI
jgi:hypothetical protein